jgi:cardiolipin synthase
MSNERVSLLCFLLCLLLLSGSCTSVPAGHPAPAGEQTLFPGTYCPDVSDLRFYFTGDTFLERAEELIRNAREYILIDSFLTIEDEKGKRVIDLLRAKMEENVDVYLITDSSSAYVQAKTAIPYLIEKGIPVAEYNPIRCNRVARLPLFLYRDHRKFWLIDGETVILGGQNIYSRSLDSPEEFGYTDSMVEFRSEVAYRELLCSFVREWNAYSMVKLREQDFAVQSQQRSDNRLWLIHQDSFRGAVIGDMFNRLMDQAQREIWLVQSYTIPTREMLMRIRELTAEGIAVNILYSSYNFHEKFHYAPGYRMIDLIEAGANLWEYEISTSHLHYKAMIVDDRWFTLGSANLNFRSYYLAKELNILFKGKQMGKAMLDNLEEMKALSHRITVEQASRYRSAKYLFYYLLLYLGG